LQFSSSVFSFTFLASQIFARVELEICALDHLDGDREFAAGLLENHGGSAYATQRSAVRLLIAHRDGRHDTRGPAAKAIVVGRSHEWAIETGRFDFERVGFALAIELRVQARGDAFAEFDVDAGRTIDHERQSKCATRASRALRHDFDVAKFPFARQRRRGAFERLDQTRDPLSPYNDEARDVPTLFLTTAA